MDVPTIRYTLNPLANPWTDSAPDGVPKVVVQIGPAARC
jgi:hypothetical protein